jgi:ribosomal protein S18 acetylase RimI-like enzyme
VAAVRQLPIRALRPQDQEHLWSWLHIALWDPPPAPLRPREVLKAPQVRIYAEDWGKPGDVGVVGELEGGAIGACWLRLLPRGVGLASVDEHTPQLGIALVPEFQRKGFGRQLLMAALQAAGAHGYHQVSLTVHPQNPAIRLYERCNFEKRDLRNTYHLMVAKLSPELLSPRCSPQCAS